ncbi:DegT/DnrJ/EryC1/StrS family aminotransferase [Chryseobacterium sp. SN22]|uniref:DegT/DnrJ/EryC1/StrS family aminotransferase n=1 Tax=Chryseobacterium sp. SN22 TaxID=2606431 RepID=UPI0029390A04|nr:DegT/DnrJ/EryC1/StrS family aminotransferase [Chryseobacterium sp. SN22]
MKTGHYTWQHRPKKKDYYSHSEIAYNYRLNISAGIGRGQMQVPEERIPEHRKNNDFYQTILNDSEIFSLFLILMKNIIPITGSIPSLNILIYKKKKLQNNF